VRAFFFGARGRQVPRLLLLPRLARRVVVIDRWRLSLDELTAVTAALLMAPLLA